MVISLGGMAVVLYQWYTNPSIWTNGIFALLCTLFFLIILLVYLWSFFTILKQQKISLTKNDFINNMTHEFKTPITTISLAADTIQSDEVIQNGERIKFYATMIKNENLRMNQQVERILQAARVDRRELDFNFQIINAHEKIEEAIQGIKIQIDKRNGRITKNFKATNPNITSDPIHFINVVYNLLDNANKYSPDAPDITISTSNDKKGFYMTVADKGVGMSKKIQDRIFEKFYRIPLLPGIKGYGIGLSYIKAILKINKGKIRVKSEPGKGSQFAVFIPFFIKGKTFKEY
jgi:two-component system phosphate regulon sensor histidine kinase PhoR